MRTLLAGLLLVLLPAPAAAAVDFAPGAGFTPAQQRDIEQAVESAAEPVQVRILARLPRQDHGSASLTARRLREASADTGIRIVVWGGLDALPAFGVAGPGESYCAVGAVRRSQLDEHQQFVELVRLVATDSGCRAMDEVIASRVRDLGVEDRSGGRVHEPADASTWLLRGLVVLAGVLLVGAVFYFRGRAWRDARLRRRRGEAITGFASDAAHRSAGEQAHADLLAFGEELDATPMRADHRMEEWQRALDDYAEACRLHDGGSREDRRVITLCVSGRRHLARAIRP